MLADLASAGAGAHRGEVPLMARAGRRAGVCRSLQLVPNLVTILGLCAGLTALRFAFAGRFEPAAALIIFAAVLDGFDGLLARKLDAASRFGAELDSLADFVNFGVAPALPRLPAGARPARPTSAGPRRWSSRSAPACGSRASTSTATRR